MSVAAKKVKQRVGFWRWIWRISAVTFASFVVLLALAIGLFRVAVPLFPNYQERIQNAVSNAIGYPTQAGSIDARWRLKGPELLFKQVKVLSEDRAETLIQADRLRVVVDVLSLLKHQKIQPAVVVLSGVALRVRRARDGQYFVQDKAVGMPVRTDTEVAAAPAWGLPNGRFSLQNFRVTYEDISVGSRTVEVSDIDVEVWVKGRELRIDGDVQLPGNLGRRLDVTLDATGSINQMEEVQWHSYVKGLEIDLEELSLWGPTTLPIAFSGTGGISAWLGGVGKQINDSSIQVDLENLSLSAGNLALPLVFEELGGHFIWERRTDQWRLQGKNLVVNYPGHSWPEGDFNLAVQIQEMQKQYSFEADYFNLDDIGLTLDLISDRPWLQEWRRRSPGGEISNLNGFVKTDNNELTDFRITGDGDNLSLLPVDGVPGFWGINAHIYGGFSDGGVNLHSSGAAFELPGVLRDSIVISALNMNVKWQQEDTGQRHARVDNIRVVADDLTARGSMYFEKNLARNELLSEMELVVDELRLGGAKKYFPINRISPRLLTWLDAALVDGVGRNGTFRLRGPLKKFPFKDQADGEFSAAIELQDARVHYAADWPDAQAVNATLRFERNSLQASIASASLMGIKLQDGRAEIPDFKQPLVTLDGKVEDDLELLREYLDATPIVAKWGKEWGNFTLRGASVADIDVDIATRNLKDTRYTIKLVTSDAEIRYRDWPQSLSNLGGSINFTHSGIFGESLKATLLGEPVALEIQPAAVADSASTVDLRLSGRMRSPSLGEHLQEAFAQFLDGEAEWVAQTRIGAAATDNAPFSITLQSSLESMQVKLPNPLAKAAAGARFLDATISVPDDGVVETVIDYGGDTNIHAVFSDTNNRWKVQRGEIRLGGGAAVLPEEDTVRAVGNVANLDVSEIIEFTGEFDSDDPWLELQEIELGIAELDGFGQNFLASELTGVHTDGAWRFTVLGDQVSGTVTVPDDSSPEQPVIGQFDVLRWTSNPEPEPLDPRAMPSITMTADNFLYDQYEMGTLQFEVEAREAIVALREFQTVGNGFETRATGSWSFGGDNETTYLIAELNSNDVRATLRSLQLAEVIDSDTMTTRWELNWPRGWTPDYLSTVEGSLKLNVGEGTLYSVDPGAGRVFGLLSIGALPRRLGLDFSDVFGSGFGFDSISGDFEIREGSAYTSNLALQGPAANVGIVGRTGLVARDYDQTAVVYANFGSSLPLAGTLAGGPAVGAALLIFAELFRSPLRQMGQVSYRITGGWDAPNITKTGSARPPEPENVDTSSDPVLPPGAGE